MKSMSYYVNSEASVYKQIRTNYQELLKPMINSFKTNETKYKSIVIFATGSSSNAAYGALPLMTERLGIPVYVEEPSIAANYQNHFQDDILYIAISQGGHSASTIKVVKELLAKKITVFVLTSDLNSPIAKTGAQLIEMGMGIEEMPYVTLGYSVTILLLILFAIEVAHQTKRLSSKGYEKDIKEIDRIIENLPHIVQQSERWADRYVNENSELKRIYFIGYGAAYGVAREGETKITETVHITAQGKELEEYMHGPYIGMHASDRFIFIEPQGKLEGRAKKLQHFLRLHAKHVTVIASYNCTNDEVDSLNLKTDVNELLTSLFMTIPIHLLAYKLAKAREINLEVPAYPEFDEITKSKL
ncbi:SIS domain-containing protein [uncultured Lactobacillus sp.]|uniref:SIS domain-containing protein n=1 Tax=uncultured Lactobacillus sp. TaxID=153152 RepID=UPI0025F02C92|nr:SIS domain-containing protein [uncultured Lactobacillus sp.]